MTARFDDAARQLDELLEGLLELDARVRLTSLWWSLCDAPDVGLSIAREAAEQMKQGQHMADDGVQDAILTMRLISECHKRTAFAFESTIRYLHASGDLLAQLINDALQLKISEGQCSLSTALDALGDQSRWSSLAVALRRLKESSEFEFVADGTNRMKHRNSLRASIGARRDARGGLDVKQSLAAFEHDTRHVTRSHSESEVEQIRTIADTLQALVGDVLSELHTVLIATTEL
jgi:hypothetical protein